MPLNWTTSQLRDLAVVRVSNVDKKSYATERPIQLCNYMDVYANDYLTAALQDFMPATASPSEIERFALHAGDVVITKDSETPDDIGVPAVIVEDIDGLVCGYHLALIRPKASVHPTFLAKQLASAPAIKYFAANATGSTRFGLAIGTIEKLDVPTPPQAEQAKIAEVLSTVDRAIEQTEAFIAKHQRIKTGLMQDLLTRGIDEHGNLRSEATHEFKDGPLGRISAEWDIVPLGELASIDRGKFTHRPRNDPRFYGGAFPFIQTGDVTSRTGRVVNSYTQTLNHRGTLVSKCFPAGTIAVTIAANIADSAIIGLPMYFPDSIVGAVVRRSHCIRFVELMIRRWKPILERRAPQSAQKNINLETLRPLAIPTPPPKEQERIGALYDSVDAVQEMTEIHLSKLRSLKTALMQDLLTGKVRVTPLLEQADATTV